MFDDVLVLRIPLIAPRQNRIVGRFASGLFCRLCCLASVLSAKVSSSERTVFCRLLTVGGIDPQVRSMPKRLIAKKKKKVVCIFAARMTTAGHLFRMPGFQHALFAFRLAFTARWKLRRRPSVISDKCFNAFGCLGAKLPSDGSSSWRVRIQRRLFFRRRHRVT